MFRCRKYLVADVNGCLAAVMGCLDAGVKGCFAVVRGCLDDVVKGCLAAVRGYLIFLLAVLGSLPIK